MKKQKVFEVVWSGCIQNDWQHDSIVADSFADAQQKAMRFFGGVKRIKSISDSDNEIWAASQPR